ncbi:MAG: DUF4835 family protein [Flavobacteriales bacterium]|jgi:hypothetical protein
MKHIFLSAFIVLSGALSAQELQCDVTIIPPRVMISGPEIFQIMETTIEEFINTRRWSRDDWNPKERIECTMQITVEQQINQRQFKGTLQVGSSRPVFNSNYKSPVVSLNDRDFEFTFQENTLIQWSVDQHRDNLSSVLAFYANLILAMDYDTFSLEGGTDYYVICQTIVSNAQNAPEPGWRSNERGQQNRYWLIENMVTQTFKPVRDCLYLYHRKGMDKLYTEPVAARQQIADALAALESVHRIKPSSYNMQVFFYAKGDELVKLYGPLDKKEKEPIANLCKLLDPGNIARYERMMQ